MAYLKRKSRNTAEQKDESTCSNNMSVVEHAESPSGDKSFINKARGRRSRNSPQFRDSSAPGWILLGHHQYGFLAKTRRLASMALLRVALDSGYLKGRHSIFLIQARWRLFPDRAELPGACLTKLLDLSQPRHQSFAESEM